MKTSITLIKSSLIRVNRLNPTDSVCQVIARVLKAGSCGNSTICRKLSRMAYTYLMDLLFHAMPIFNHRFPIIQKENRSYQCG